MQPCRSRRSLGEERAQKRDNRGRASRLGTQHFIWGCRVREQRARQGQPLRAALRLPGPRPFPWAPRQRRCLLPAPGSSGFGEGFKRVAKQVQASLPVIGLISRLASPEGGVGSDMQVRPVLPSVSVSVNIAHFFCFSGQRCGGGRKPGRAHRQALGWPRLQNACSAVGGPARGREVFEKFKVRRTLSLRVGSSGLRPGPAFPGSRPAAAAHKLTCSAPRLLGSHGSHAGLGWGCCRNTPRHMHAHKLHIRTLATILHITIISTTTAQLAQTNYLSRVTQLQLRDCRRTPSSAARCLRRRRWGSRLRWQSCKRGTARWAALCCDLLCGAVLRAFWGSAQEAAQQAVLAYAGE